MIGPDVTLRGCRDVKAQELPNQLTAQCTWWCPIDRLDSGSDASVVPSITVMDAGRAARSSRQQSANRRWPPVDGQPMESGLIPPRSRPSLGSSSTADEWGARLAYMSLALFLVAAA